jgi:protein-S-isoprenylcysteine O-methyltransferase Ste14
LKGPPARWSSLAIVAEPEVAARTRVQPERQHEKVFSLFVAANGFPLFQHLTMMLVSVIEQNWPEVQLFSAKQLNASSPVQSEKWLGMALAPMNLISDISRKPRFSTRVVRIQTERAHKVTSAVPYGVVRHPFYAALAIFLSNTLMLGSWHGIAVAAALVALFVLRTLQEDRKLEKDLEGYAEYSAKVRYRLLPFVW